MERTKGGARSASPSRCPRGSKRGQRITKNTVRRSNTLPSLSLILPPRMKPPHVTHALERSLGSHQQSVPNANGIPTCENNLLPATLDQRIDIDRSSTETLDTRKKSAKLATLASINPFPDPERSQAVQKKGMRRARRRWKTVDGRVDDSEGESQRRSRSRAGTLSWSRRWRRSVGVFFFITRQS